MTKRKTVCFLKSMRHCASPMHSVRNDAASLPHLSGCLFRQRMQLSMRTSVFLLALLTFTLWTATLAYAQDDPQEPALPDIAPREVEILGQLEISLPSLQRQPLIGFNPPPRMAEIPANRRPHVEPYGQDRADLPESPLGAPQAPAISSLAGKQPINGEFEASAGRYLTRIVRGRAGIPLSPESAFYGRLDYQGSDGHRPYDSDTDLRAPFNTLEAVLGVQTVQSSWTAGAEFDGFADRYKLYGVRTGLTTPSNGQSLPDRDGQEGAAVLWLRTQGTAAASLDVRARIGSSQYQTDALSGQNTESSSDRTAYNEQRFGLNLALDVPMGSNGLLLDGELSAAGLAADENLEGNTTLYSGGAAVRFRYQRAFNVKLGVRGMGFSADGDRLTTTTDSDIQKGYIAPVIQVELYPAYGTRLYVQNHPGVEGNALPELFRKNPYLVALPVVQPTVRTINASGGIDLFAGPVQLAGEVGYEAAPNYLFFEHSGGLLNVRQGLSEARYGEARIMRAGGNLSVVLPGGFQTTLSAALRDGTLTGDDSDEDTTIPYFGPITGQAMLSYSFDRSRGLIQLVGTYESARFRDRAETRKIGDFFDLDVSASYQFSPSLGIVANVQNISAGYLERWDNYPIAPLVITGGMQVRW